MKCKHCNREPVLAPFVDGVCDHCWPDMINAASDALDLLRHRRVMRLASMPYREYLATPEWKERREAAIKEHPWCALCGERESGFEVHHSTYARRGREAPEDLTVLCWRCHSIHHDINGDVPLRVVTEIPA